MEAIFKAINLNITMLPIFAGALLIELLVGINKGHKLYRLKDTFTNLAIGILIALPGFLSKGIAFVIYSAVYQIAPWHLPSTFWCFVLCFIGSDLIFYLFHRLGHETQLFWAGHVTHHSSKEFNLSVAFRLPANSFYRFLFWAPLALLGFSPNMIILADSLVYIYGFYLHTKLIGKLGPIEWIFNTPSHHRVHHASNKEYLDKNFGGVLIIWDRLFRTATVETIAPTYGITHDVNTHNPIQLQLDEYIRTFRNAFNSGSWRKAIGYLFSKPQGIDTLRSSHNCNKCRIACPFKAPFEEQWNIKVIAPLVGKINAA
jgi:sterol desaturase/sphingolipid hydroxylase (fatty acid hydroxylase superfamily)